MARTRGKPFKGTGNPTGRPKGARNKKTLLAEALLDEHVEMATGKLVELVSAGNLQAIALHLKLVFPNGRQRPVALKLPKLVTSADDLNALAAIAEAAARGDISPAEARDLSGIVELHMRGLERASFEERLQRLEAAAEGHHEAITSRPN